MKPQTEQIVALRRQGVRPFDIAARLGVTASTVSGALHRAGLTTEAKGRGATTEAFRRRVAASHGANLLVSRQWNVSEESVRQWRKEFAQ